MVRLVNPAPHKPTIYPAMKLPPMVNVAKTNDPALPSRIQQPAPQPKLNVPAAPAPKLGPMTNTVNQVRK
jgi:hypothetical protein